MCSHTQDRFHYYVLYVWLCKDLHMNHSVFLHVYLEIYRVTGDLKDRWLLIDEGLGCNRYNAFDISYVRIVHINICDCKNVIYM